MKEKNTMEILQEIREYRKSQMAEIGQVNLSVTVQPLGEGDKSKQTIYRLLEVYTQNGKTSVNEFFYKYNEKPELIGIRNQATDGRLIPVPTRDESVDSLEAKKDEIERCLAEREIQMKAMAKEIGIPEEEIASLSEAEIERRIIEKSGADKRAEAGEGQEGREEDGVQKISKEKVYSIGAMNEIRTEQPIDNQGNTLGKALGLEEYSKIIVVHAYRIPELTDSEGNAGKRQSLSFGFIGQKEDGTFETIPFDKISMYRGNNNEVSTITDDQEDKTVETRNDEYIFNTQKGDMKLVIRQDDPYGIPEVYLARNTRDGKYSVGAELQDQYDGTEKTDVEVRNLFNPNKGINQTTQMKEEIKEHEEAGDKNIGVKNADGDKTTGHQHPKSPEDILVYQGNEMTVADVARLPRFNISPEGFISKYNHIVEENPKCEPEEIYNKIEDEVNEEYRNFSEKRRQ